MPINAVVGRVQASADKPAHARLVEVRILYLVPWLEPVQQRPRPFRPETVVVGPGQFAQRVIFAAAADTGHVFAVTGGKVAAVLVEEALDAILRHGEFLVG